MEGASNQEPAGIRSSRERAERASRVALASIGSTILLALAVAFTGPLAPHAASAAPPSFTGDVTEDFDPSDSDVVVVADPGGVDVVIPSPLVGPSGHDIEDLRFYYDRSGDTLYVGINTYTIAGDVDNDGDPNRTSEELDELGGKDEIDFHLSESFGIVLDTDLDGDGDAIVGVSCGTDLFGFAAHRFVGILEVPFCSFGPPLASQSGTTTDPATNGPDLEFTIPNFSGLPGLPHDPREHPIRVGVLGFLGSFDDVVVGEDYVPASATLETISLALPATVAGRVFHDLDVDGIRDPGEPDIEGIDVELVATFSDEGPAQVETFTSLPSGLYGFLVDVPAFETAECTLSIATESLVGWELTTEATRVVSGIAPDETDAGNHFGLVPAPARIRGTVFDDLDGDGVFDEGESGLAGVPVTLSGSIREGGPVTDATTTASDGTFELSIPLDPGEIADADVSVDPEDVDGYSATTATTRTLLGIELQDVLEANDFGFEELRSFVWVEGQVFVDPDADGFSAGAQDGFGSARVSIDVDIHGGGTESAVVTTTGDGMFGTQVPVPIDAIVDVLVSLQPSDFPGVMFTTPTARVVSNVAAEGVVEDVDFGFRAERIPIFGDWDGDGVYTVGLYEASTATFYLRNTNSAGPAEISFTFAVPDAVPVAGDWDGDGRHSIGIYEPAEGRFRLRNELSSGGADHVIRFGPRGGMNPIAGDWNGDGIDTIGIHGADTGQFFLIDDHESGTADHSFRFGGGGFSPIVGDWNRDGIDTVGIYDPPEKTFFLRNEHAGGAADHAFRFAIPNAVPVAGNWVGRAKDTIGVYDPREDRFLLRKWLGNGIAHWDFEFSTNTWIPIYGDWDGNGTETVAVFDPANARWLIRNQNDSGEQEYDFVFGQENERPIVGDWDGDGRDGIGTYDPEAGRFRVKDALERGPADRVFRFGPSGAVPLVGDWNHDGLDTVGIYAPEHGAFFLRDDNGGGDADYSFEFDEPMRAPIVGDWNGDGFDTVGTYDAETCTYRLRDALSAGEAHRTFAFGTQTGTCSPLAGDWDGDGTTTIGAHRARSGQHQLRSTNDSGPPDRRFTFPIPFW